MQSFPSFDSIACRATRFCIMYGISTAVGTIYDMIMRKQKFITFRIDTPQIHVSRFFSGFQPELVDREMGRFSPTDVALQPFLEKYSETKASDMYHVLADLNSILLNRFVDVCENGSQASTEVDSFEMNVGWIFH
jgi:hypothetical protein